MTDGEWLTTEQAAVAIGVARQTVSRWIRERKLPARAIRVHGRRVYRIRQSDLLAFVRRYVTDTWR